MARTNDGQPPPKMSLKESMPPEVRPRTLLGVEIPPTGRLIRLGLVLVVASLGYWIPVEGLTEAGQRMLFIFLLAAGLWVTEVIQPYATAILAVGLQVVLLGLPGGPLEFESGQYAFFLRPIASPVIVLFFGGFVLALAAGKYGLDRAIASMILRAVGSRPSRVLMGVLGVTALFSMWMSNTATAAMMLAVVLPLVRSLEKDDPYRIGLVLAIAVGANLGGMGTIIGSPPNGIAVITLEQKGLSVNFLGWMIMAVPVMIPLLFFAWLLLMRRYPAKTSKITAPEGTTPPLVWQSVMVCGTFIVCVLLWMTEGLHGIPAPVVAILPVAVFTVFAIIGPGDLGRLDWHVLILVAGGISLGEGIRISGLSAWFIDAVPFQHLGPFWILIAFAILAVVFSNFMSNSASAALLIPVATSVADQTPIAAAVVVALAATSAMSLPVSTPPNALAHASGELKGGALLKNGTLISCASLVLLAILGWILLRFAN